MRQREKELHMTRAGLATKGGVPKKYKKCGIFHTWVDPGSKVWQTNFFDFGFRTIIGSFPPKNIFFPFLPCTLLYVRHKTTFCWGLYQSRLRSPPRPLSCMVGISADRITEIPKVQISLHPPRQVWRSEVEKKHDDFLLYPGQVWETERGRLH